MFFPLVPVHARIGVCFVLSWTLLGCGPRVAPPGDPEEVRRVVAEVSEARTNPEKLAALFVEGKSPDRKWLSGLTKRSLVVDAIDVQGDEATVQLHLETFQGEALGQTVWKCQRTGEQWQIADAPLSASSTP